MTTPPAPSGSKTMKDFWLASKASEADIARAVDEFWRGRVWIPYTMRPVEIRTHVCRRGRLWRKRVDGNPAL